MESFKKHIPAFAAKLENIDVTGISVDGYAQQYLQDLIIHRTHYLHLYAMVLDKALEASSKTLAATCLLDFGCGNGLLALFAKYCGVNEVHASDMSGPFLQSAQVLGNQLGISIDGWILGTENRLQEHFAANQLDIVVGTDVIEHVYSLDSLFRTIKQLNPNMVTVFTTASVAENPFKSTKLKALQRKDELQASNVLHSTYNNEYAGLPFLAIRKKLITDKYPLLTENETQQLALASRGLIEADIYRDVDQYLLSGKFPLPIKHPTNTCDPFTGSWTERLLSVEEYRLLYSRYRFSLQVSNGFYNEYEGNLKSKVSAWLNVIIRLLGSKGIHVSPFILLTGKANP